LLERGRYAATYTEVNVLAVKIRLARAGAKKAPFYRVVAADSRAPRDGRFIEILGRYNPRTEPSLIELDLEKVDAWLAKGAEPSETVAKLIAIAKNPEATAPSKGEALSKKAQAKAEADRKAASEAAEAAAKAKAEAAEAPAAEETPRESTEQPAEGDRAVVEADLDENGVETPDVPRESTEAPAEGDAEVIEAGLAAAEAAEEAAE
jgi:small subunit ribosomal protein S16